MRVIVSDSSVLIDLAKVRLIEAAFGLPYEFQVPDILLADELIDLGPYRTQDLLAAGLVVGHLDGHGVELVQDYMRRHPPLSINDCFALALARINHALLLTGDDNLRKAAAAEIVTVHGLLWLSDRLQEHRVVSDAQLRAALEAWDADPLVWLPRHELRLQIRKLS